MCRLAYLCLSTMLVFTSAGCKEPSQRHTEPVSAKKQQNTTSKKKKIKRGLGRRRPRIQSGKPLVKDDLQKLAEIKTTTDAILVAAQSALLGTPFPKTANAKDVTVVRSAQLAKHVQASGITKLMLMGLELELVLYQGARVAYYLRTFVHPANVGARFFRVAGRVPKSGKISVTSHELTRYKGSSAGLAKTARGLLQLVKSNKCRSLPFVDIKTLRPVLKPGVATQRLVVGLKRAGLMLGSTCDQIANIKFDSVQLRIDDIAFGGIDKVGKLATTIHGEIELEPDGNLRLRIKQLRDTR
jgi:hypothetical protein